MQTFLNKLGLLETTNNNVKTDLKLYYIKNKDQSIRWLWNSNCKEPIFLKFYSASSIKAKLFVALCKIIFKLQLQHIVFYKSFIYVNINISSSLKEYYTTNFSIFTGTTGPNQKLVLYSESKKEKLFLKIPISEKSQLLINQEFNNLKLISDLNPCNFRVPEARMIHKHWLATKDTSGDEKRLNKFTHIHADALKELYEKTKGEATLNSLNCFNNAKQKLQELKKTQSAIPKGLIKNLELLGNSFTNDLILTSLAHQDFTPWNCYAEKNLLSIYDWELTENNLPAAFDVFHFVIQKSILIDGLNWNQIVPELQNAFLKFIYKKSDFRFENFEKYLSYYLYIHTINSLHLYATQKEWHVQIQWLINTWNDGICSLLQDFTDNRKLLIQYVFDYLTEKNYAAIKFPNIAPDSLSQMSDIDLCLSKEDAKQLVKRIKSFGFIKHVSVIKTSFMYTISIILNDYSILNLDLIWKFKRKSVEFLNLNEVLKNSLTNQFGVKIMDLNTCRNYIKYFYGLNNANIPEKYMEYMENDSKAILNPQLLEYELRKEGFNKGIDKIRNQFLYVFDTIKSFIGRKGMVITFSGVDGAGKSTIIEHTKIALEKKFRKKVTVIRHRPSYLPILSAITNGKAKAEAISMSQLPRQGKNESFGSSLLRFGYYYVDYLFGQFLIYTKHVLRGEIVLYDRYYFDFINDGKRSNIKLPKFLLLMGYKLLLQPKLNFFLYADSQTILNRKQELKKETIEKLTSEYKSLFNYLNKSGSAQYVSIENIYINDTMSIISKKITKNLM
jgi:thymidylate kinase